MDDFMEMVEKQRRRKRFVELAIKKTIICGAVIGAAFLSTGYYDGDQVLVEEIYTVQKGDTLRHIAEEYLEKNTGGRRYILEFESGICELNPWLQKGNVIIHPGDKIRINYWVSRGGEADED